MSFEKCMYIHFFGDEALIFANKWSKTKRNKNKKRTKPIAMSFQILPLNLFNYEK